MSKHLPVVAILFYTLSFGCGQTKDKAIKLDFYIAPKRYVCMLFIDNGVFNYKLERKSIWLLKSDCCFLEDHPANEDPKDSAVTMFYHQATVSKLEFDKIVAPGNPLKDTSFKTRPVRALIAVHDDGKTDSIFIYGEKIWTYQGKGYQMKGPLDSFFSAPLPPELKANWQ